jgi:zinc transport system substrate-binding protein
VKVKKHVYLLMLSLFFMSVAPVYGAVDVFVSIPPQKWLVKKVGGDLVNVGVLVNKSQDPHTFEPSPRQVAALTGARIWFTMDMEFEAQLARKVREVASGLTVVDIADNLPAVPLETNQESDGAASHAEDEHGDDADAHPHEHAGLDPHVWLSPLNLQMMAGNIAEALAVADPANRNVYGENLAAVNNELNVLHQDITRQLAPFAGASFYVFHPSFGHFARTYGLVQKAVEIGGKSPSPRQLTQLIGKAREEKVKVIFVQPQFDPKSAGAVASAIGGRVVPLDALAEDVPANLKDMANQIENALSR